MKPQLYPEHPILIVDDELEVLEGCEMTLRSCGLTNVLTCQNSLEVPAILERQPVQLILMDLIMPGLTGEELLQKVYESYPYIPVIIVTGRNELEIAVNCMKSGAIDYLVKPVEGQKLVSIVQSAIDTIEERAGFQRFKQLVFNDELEFPQAFEKIIGNSKKMRSIFQYVEAIAASSKPVLITGDSGVGKNLIAEAIHTVSSKKGAYVPVNIAGLDDTMFSDTLFGHLEGAYTGAKGKRKGLIEQAAGGTVFLDEIGDLNAANQVKLLRLLDEGEYFTMGSDIVKKTDARFIAATNRDLKSLQQEGTFRTDLYYRFQIHHIHIPPLSNRMDDLPLLVDCFATETAESLGKPVPETNNELLALLARYSFPGNVRELKSMIFDAMSFDKSEGISIERVQNYIVEHSSEKFDLGPVLPVNDLYAFSSDLPTLKAARKQLIEEALKRSDGNVTKASRILGITQSGLSKIISRELS